MSRRRIATTVLAAMLAAGLVACSDDSGLTGNQKHAISDFRVGADAICARSNVEAQGWRDQYQAEFAGRTPTADEAMSFLVRVVLPQADKQVGDLHNLGEPTLDRTSWDSIMRQVDDGLSSLKASANADPLATVTQIVAVRTAQSEIERAFDAFGAKECAKPG
jgi:hypothetical protein